MFGVAAAFIPIFEVYVVLNVFAGAATVAAFIASFTYGECQFMYGECQFTYGEFQWSASVYCFTIADTLAKTTCVCCLNSSFFMCLFIDGVINDTDNIHARGF